MTPNDQTEMPDIAALIGSRICHDLISPLGAIGNGVELLTMSGGGMGPEMALISDSVENANARIRFFRLAFGAASMEQAVGQAEIVSILTDLYKGSRLNIAWLPTEDVPRGEVKLAFLLLQCLDSAMPYGGQVQVTRTDTTWRMSGEADKLKPDPSLWDPLAEMAAPSDVNANQVHFALVPPQLFALNRRLVIDRAETRISFGF